MHTLDTEISDPQVAEEVLGWHYDPSTRVWCHQGQRITQLPAFTTSRSDMWVVLDALEARGLTYQITVGSGTAGCSISDRSARVTAGRVGATMNYPASWAERRWLPFTGWAGLMFLDESPARQASAPAHRTWKQGESHAHDHRGQP